MLIRMPSIATLGKRAARNSKIAVIDEPDGIRYVPKVFLPPLFNRNLQGFKKRQNDK